MAALLKKDAIDSRVIGKFPANETPDEGSDGDARQQTASFGVLDEILCILDLQ